MHPKKDDARAQAEKGLTFLGHFWFTSRLTLRISNAELKKKPGFPTSNLNQRFKANSGSTLVLHPGKSSVGKLMASVFWDSEGVIMIDYLEKGKPINSNA